MTLPGNPDLRTERLALVRRTREIIDLLDTSLGDALDARNEVLIACHGDKREGGLSYAELAEASGVTQGRVRQIVQGKSDYSKEWLRARNHD